LHYSIFEVLLSFFDIDTRTGQSASTAIAVTSLSAPYHEVVPATCLPVITDNRLRK